ncbi:MAG: hypothetical protein ABR985_02565 [Methanotrichaceae archaeon]|jgi:hypothetical protein
MEQVQNDRALEYMAEIGKKINPKINTDVFRRMIVLSVHDQQDELERLERTHQPERELLNCLRGIE